MIDRWPSSLLSTFSVTVLFFSFVVVLWLLKYWLRHFVDHRRGFMPVERHCCSGEVLVTWSYIRVKTFCLMWFTGYRRPKFWVPHTIYLRVWCIVVALTTRSSTRARARGRVLCHT